MTAKVFLSVVNPTGVWLVEPAYADAVADELINTTASSYYDKAEKVIAAKREAHEQLQARMNRSREESGSYFTGMIDPTGMLTVELRGAVTEAHSSFSDDGIVLSDVLPFFEAADADPSVTGILMRITTPGGVAIPSLNAGEILAKINATTPIIAYCDGLCASAGIAMIAGASYVFSSPAVIVGGVAAVYRGYDRKTDGTYSKPVIIASGKKKIETEMRGEDGFLTAESIAAKQKEIDQLGSQFVDFVMRERQIDAAKRDTIAEGGYWIGGKEALKSGLVDKIALWSEARAQAPKLIAKIKKEKK